MDALYDRLLVRPFIALAHLNRKDIIDTGYASIAAFTHAGNNLLVRTQTGNLRWYSISMIGGLIIVIAVGVWR